MAVSNIKTFLGQRPTRVIENLSQFSEEEQDQFKGVSQYLLQNGLSQTVLDKYSLIPELGIVGLLSFNLAIPVVVTKEEEYVPLHCGFNVNMFQPSTKKYRRGIYTPKNVFYIKGIGARPNLGRLLLHFKKLLSSEYTGAVDTELPGAMGNRYVVLLSNLNTSYLYTLLDSATKGDGKCIDYSWIAPLQELVEKSEDLAHKKAKSLKERLLADEPEENVAMPDMLDGPPRPRGAGFASARADFLSALKKEIVKSTPKNTW